MSNIPVNHQPIQNMPTFGSQSNLPTDAVNVGAVSIESNRAIAEAQGQLVLAKRFPRNFNAAMEEALNSCSYPDFAEEAFYSVPRGGGSVTGPSIRLAEELARCYGNFQYGHRELSRSDDRSEVEVWAWDVERNNRSTRQITVMHIRDTKGGGQRLTSQKDINDHIANVASKQMRSRVLALLPKPMVAACVTRCKETLTGSSNETVQQRIAKMQAAFSRYGVTVAMLEKYLGHALDATPLDEIADLVGIFNAIKEGSPIKEFFTLSDAPSEDGQIVRAKDIIARSKAGNVNASPTGEVLTKPEATTEAIRPNPQTENKIENAPTPEKDAVAEPKKAAAVRTTRKKPETTSETTPDTTPGADEGHSVEGVNEPVKQEAAPNLPQTDPTESLQNDEPPQMTEEPPAHTEVPQGGDTDSVDYF